MKRILLIVDMLMAVAVSYAQSYDFALSSSTDPDTNLPNLGGFDAVLQFKINPDSTSVTLTSVVPYGAYNKVVGTALTLPAAVSNGDSETGTAYDVTKIGAGAFRELEFVSIVLPQGLQEICDSAFYSARFDSLTLYGGLDRIAATAFGRAPNSPDSILTYFNFMGTIQQWLDLDLEGPQASPVYWTHAMRFYDTLLTHLIVPEGVYTLKPHHFFWNFALESVVLPTTIDSIGEGTFMFCIHLDSIFIPYGVRYIGNRAFDNCQSLRVVNFQAHRCGYAGSAGLSLFAGCNVQKIILGENVELIPDYLFMYCSGVTHIELPQYLTRIGTCGFAACSGLDGRLELPRRLSSLGGHAFANCQGIDTIVLNAPSCGLENVNLPPFTYDSLTRVLVIGEDVEILAGSIFSGLRGVDRIISHAEEPPYVTNNTVFEDIDQGAYVTVPCGHENDYRTSTGWDRYYTIRSTDMFDFQVLSADETMGTVRVLIEPECAYLWGKIKATPKAGYQFVRWSDDNTDTLRWVQVEGDTLFTAYFAPASESMLDVDGAMVRVFSQQGCIVVEGDVDGQVLVSDIMGRTIVRQQFSGTTRIEVPTKGVYLVRIGSHTVRKVVVR